MSGELRIGVLGLGRIGRLHADLLQRRVAGTRVTAVYDPMGTAVDVGAPHAPSAEALMASPDVDAIAICTTTDTHVDLLLAAARAGKPVFCEKPVSLDLPAVDRVAAAVRAAGVPVHIGFNRRFDPAHASVRAAVENGTVGDPELLRITSRDPEPPPLEYIPGSGGLFLDMTVHDFDMARFVSGSEVVTVTAHATRRVLPEVDDVDTAVITLEHANGCLTAIDNSRHASYGYDQRVEVHGSLGLAASEDPHAHTGLVRTAAGTLTAPLPFFFLERYVPSYVAQWEAFAAAVREDAPVPTTIDDARAALVAGLAARRSLTERRPVAVAELEGAPA